MMFIGCFIPSTVKPLSLEQMVNRLLSDLHMRTVNSKGLVVVDLKLGSDGTSLQQESASHCTNHSLPRGYNSDRASSFFSDNVPVHPLS